MTALPAEPSPAAVTSDPRVAQAEMYEVCWDPSSSDHERLLAARGAIAASIRVHGAPVGLPPGEEALGLFEEALDAAEDVLDAIFVLGRLPAPLSQDFGSLLIGALFDLHDQRRFEDLLIVEQDGAERLSRTRIGGHMPPAPGTVAFEDYVRSQTAAA